MSWTDRNDRIAVCPGEHGAVADEERVARLLHSRNSEPHMEPFATSDLFPSRKKAFSNQCGEADGFSVTRRLNRSDDDLRAMSKAFADLKRDVREPRGAIEGTVQELRAIRVDALGDEQVVFVYDDPTIDDPAHAVIRGSDKLDRPEQQNLREVLKGVFRLRITTE